MTKEEAAKVLKLERDSWRENPKLIVDQRLYDAINTAIEDLGQEPKSEWQHDHEILKAYSNGANDVLDKIEEEVLEYIDDLDIANEICKIFDKYESESEGA
jgi:DNA-binding XRE family transcriptional regulator